MINSDERRILFERIANQQERVLLDHSFQLANHPLEIIEHVQLIGFGDAQRLRYLDRAVRLVYEQPLAGPQKWHIAVRADSAERDTLPSDRLLQQRVPAAAYNHRERNPGDDFVDRQRQILRST